MRFWSGHVRYAWTARAPPCRGRYFEILYSGRRGSSDHARNRCSQSKPKVQSRYPSTRIWISIALAHTTTAATGPLQRFTASPRGPARRSRFRPLAALGAAALLRSSGRMDQRPALVRRSTLIPLDPSRATPDGLYRRAGRNVSGGQATCIPAAQFHVPSTATHLYLGYASSCNNTSPGCYSSNVGTLSAVLQLNQYVLDWIETTSSSAPSDRCDVAMVYNPDMLGSLLFGGGNGGEQPGITYGDTWIWRDGWHELAPAASPSERQAQGWLTIR